MLYPGYVPAHNAIPVYDALEGMSIALDSRLSYEEAHEQECQERCYL